MNDDPRGSMIEQGNIMRINNGFVEEVFCFDNSSGYMIVSYSVPHDGNGSSIQNIRLNLGRDTTILNATGQNVCICCLQAGMWVDVAFSSRMTRSSPPQASAFWVDIRQSAIFWPPQQQFDITTGRIVLVDFSGSFFITQQPSDPDGQTRFMVTNATTFTNRFNIPIGFNALEPGQMARITHANFMTASIPPQTTAFNVHLL